MKKTILIIIAYACLASSCGAPRRIKNAFTYCYTDTYTGIDTLINIDGYYSAHPSMIFYDNGLVVGPFGFGYNMEQFRNNDTLFLKEIAENPEAKYSKTFYDFINCGSYVICGDTIKVQLIHKSYSMNDDWVGREFWYKIIDRDSLHFLDYFLITTNKKEKEFVKKYYPFKGGLTKDFVSVPAKPPLDYYWILKEKWFWCNEQDWKDYMKKIEQKKTKKK